MTKRNFYEAMINFAKGNGFEYETEDGAVEVEMDEVIAFAENEIALLQKKNDKAKERAAAKRAEGDALTALVEAELTDEFRTIAEIAAGVAEKDAEATISKVTYRLTQLVKNQKAVKEQIKIEGGEGQKARQVMAYKLV